MKWNSVKGYVLVVVSGLFFLAGIILVLTNIKNSADLWFGQNLVGKTGIIMIASAVCGVVAYWMGKWMIWGIKDIRKGSLEAKIDKVDQMEKQQKKQSQADA